MNNFVTCVCGAHILKVEYDKDIDCIDILFIDPGKYGWLYRLRIIWRIIKTGRPYADMITLDKKSARKLMNILKNMNKL